MYQLVSRIAAVAVVAAAGLVTGANAQPFKHGGGGGAPAAAPHIAAPPAPHISAPAPHVSAPAHIAAPHVSAPAHIAAPRVNAPRMAAPHVTPHVNAPQFARGHGAPVGALHRQAMPHRAAPHIAAAPRQLRGAERRLSRGPTPNIGTQGQGTKGTAHNLARQHLPVADTTNKTPATVGKTPATVGVREAGGREHGRGALTQAQRNLIDRSQRQGTTLNSKGTPVLRNPALASLSRRDPATRQLANATFKGNFAEHFRDFDHDRFHRRHFRHFSFVLGWIGPVFWPYAYDDFVDYVFYPVAYDVFWPYAYDDVYDSVLGEFAYTGEEAVGTVSGRRGRGRARLAQAGGGRPQVCAAQAPQLIDLPVQRITQTVQPDDSQRAALDDLKDAIAQAVKVLQSACPTDVPTAPVGRLRAMQNRLNVMLQAVQIVRPALEKFYGGLNDEQKARFNAMAIGQEQPQQARRDLTQICSARAAGAGGLPIDRIEKALRLSDDQRAKLDDLQKASLRAADQLKADCPADQPVTPVARLQAMEQRLDAMLQSVQTVQPPLEAFYNSLSDEQKTRFNTMSLQQV